MGTPEGTNDGVSVGNGGSRGEAVPELAYLNEVNVVRDMMEDGEINCGAPEQNGRFFRMLYQNVEGDSWTLCEAMENEDTRCGGGGSALVVVWNESLGAFCEEFRKAKEPRELTAERSAR